MASSDIKKLIVAGGLFVAAIVLYAWLRPTDEQAPDAADTASAWYCTACQQGFELTAAESASRVSRVPSGPPASDDGAESDVPTDRGRQGFHKVAKCRTCDQATGVAAIKCRQCSGIYKASAKGEPRAVCPSCQ